MAHTLNIKNGGLDRILSRHDIIMNDAIEALYVHGDAVREELDIIATIPAIVRSRRAATFAILSPQCAFEANVRAVRTLTYGLRDGFTDTAILYALRDDGHYMNNLRKVAQYRKSSHVMFGDLSDYTYATLTRCAGYGPKTASMALALHNERARVMTLDTWMIAGMLGENTATSRNAITYTLTNAAYRRAADMLLSIADTLNVTPFHLQWSLWCYYRGNKFQSHLAIYR